MILLVVVFCQAFLTVAACPDTIVIKNVNWGNPPDGFSWILTDQMWNVDTMNGKSESLKFHKHQFYFKENIERLPEDLLATGEYHFIYDGLPIKNICEYLTKV